jgi:hypothetical protein
MIPISLTSIVVLDREYNGLMNNYFSKKYESETHLESPKDEEMWKFKRDKEPLRSDPMLQILKACAWPVCLPYSFYRNYDLRKRM